MSNKIGLCKYCWEVLCSQCQENLIDDDNDHVSKSELRAWCEDGMKLLDEQRDPMTNLLYAMHQVILEKFCAGEK